MTTTINGSLLYGVDLGGGDQPWQVRHTAAPQHRVQSPHELSWYDPDSIYDFRDQANLRLACADRPVDHTAVADPASAAAARVGAHLECYSWEVAPSFVLAASITTAYYDTPVQVDLLDLHGRHQAEGWDAKLAAALALLGVTHMTAQPCWMVTASE
ncbi:hypothetical protein [Alloactinosynnema sp. L-07]|uniref:hypothetical protein n=1 Tax=Alloactinosynnema sp. L-07 TaxID=1653480 RepID=UPI00065F0AD1|nr:hypothetical protein [Alloactinosynnema sp. L-07]CRK56967.1 hypothetical protein [Alloactinosynnema sp. L-07]